MDQQEYSQQVRKSERPIGAKGLGDLAQRQLASARSDPRIQHKGEAIVLDFWHAIEEAERNRELGIWGAFELRAALEREEQRLGVRRSDSTLGDIERASLQAAWERSELAAAEIENEHPHVHATTLISMLSALDAFVEILVPSARDMLVAVSTEHTMHMFDGAIAQEEARLRAAYQRRLPKLEPLRGVGVERYEKRLKGAGLEAPAGRPIPDDLDRALCEIGAIRHVLIHRASRVDTKALDQAPTLDYKEGELVRLSRSDYRTYSAAICAYGEEIVRRLYRDLVSDVDLNNWRLFCVVGA